MENKYIDFKIAPYCLAHLLLALSQSDITDFTITLEDSDLHIRISEEHLMKIVYKVVGTDGVARNEN